MAKWVKIKETYINIGLIRHITNANGGVFIDAMHVADFKTEQEAEQFIKDFIAEHYISTEKVG